MKRATILAVGMVLALSIDKAGADASDPIVVVPDQAVVQAGQEVAVNVTATDVRSTDRPKASLIIYRPDGVMLKGRPRSMRKANAKFRLLFGSAPQIGTYTVYATVENGSEGFGMPTQFEITE